MSESFYSDKEQTTTTENYNSSYLLHIYTVVEDIFFVKLKKIFKKDI